MGIDAKICANMDKNESLRREAEQVLANAECLYNGKEVEAALDRMAREISTTLGDQNPVVLCLMLGATVVTGCLLPRLGFPMELDYLHATRYRDQTRGADLQWLRKPGEKISGRTILVLDDILDEGLTMQSIVDECLRAGARKIYTAVLVDKQLQRQRRFPGADFTGLQVPDKYVFGYGMDYKGYLRNCNGIYAVADD